MARTEDARGLITIATLLWDANEESYPFSRMYNEKWVTRLYDGCARNLQIPWRFVLFTERPRKLPSEIKQERMKAAKPGYGDCIEPYRFGVPMILMGLDTIITGPINHMAQYCLREDVKLALPQDPNQEKGIACNGVALIPAGHQFIYRNWKDENDMLYLRKQPHVLIDDLFPGQVQSFKGHVKANGLGDTRIVYFHGDEKPNQLKSEPWIRKHWLGE
jgi:hypothetical protein